jgi:multimeric flavodoxin WrbA
MSKIAVVYYSGYGHTKVIAETFANEIQATFIEVDQEGNIQDQDWDTLDAADAIVFGAPTYMGGVPWQFKNLLMHLLSVGLLVHGQIRFSVALPTAQV